MFRANLRFQLLKNPGGELTFKMRTIFPGAQLVLDGSDYTIDVEGTTRRYTAKESGIVVEVEVRSNTHVSLKRPEWIWEALPAILSVE